LPSLRPLALTRTWQNRALTEFSPLLGQLTVPGDRAKVIPHCASCFATKFQFVCFQIEELMQQLRPFIKEVRVGYSGQRNSTGQHHGLGVFSSDQGHSYRGQWSAGKQHGSGCYYWTNGSCYSGEFVLNKRHGLGRVKCAEIPLRLIYQQQA
jgi:hypothetical protein